MQRTTIQIGTDTLAKLRLLKAFERQSYDEILKDLLERFDDEPLSAQEVKEIEEGLANIKRGKVKPIEQVAEEMGISLG